MMDATVIRASSTREWLDPRGTYHVQCIGADGKEKWSEVIENLVTTVGKNHILDTYFSGSAYTPSIVVGLKGAGSAIIGDTQASHAGWLEVGGTNSPAYTGSRKIPTWNAASGASKSTTPVSFIFSSSGTVAGIFLNNGGSSTKDDTTGILYSAGDFTSGSKTVDNGDTINVTYAAQA